MTQVTFLGAAIEVKGNFPKAGEHAANFSLVAQDLADTDLAVFSGKRKVLNIFPSVDTDVCANSVRHFNQSASTLNNTVVLCISADLPFAQARFCGAEGLDNVVTLSTMRGWGFKQDYGVDVASGPLAGLCARAVIVLDENNTVLYSQRVAEITTEPDYDAAIKAVQA